MALRNQRLKERKLSNTRTTIASGFSAVPYTTTAQAHDDYDRSVEDVMAATEWSSRRWKGANSFLGAPLSQK